MEAMRYARSITAILLLAGMTIPGVSPGLTVFVPGPVHARVVRVIDEVALAEKRDVTVPLVRGVLIERPDGEDGEGEAGGGAGDPR